MPAKSAGLLRQPSVSRQELAALGNTPGTASTAPVPLTELTPEALTQALQVAALAIGKRRWQLMPETKTPNLAAVRALVATRYGSNDDVPHRDLLSDALAEDGTLRQLIED
jgi:hypothetical protein